MDDRTTGASPHELLLALAGRIDDDLLAWCRELVAVGEDGHALELLTATLIADRTPLPPAERAAVVAAARAARTDLDADAALAAAEAEYGTAHRFGAGPSVDALAAAVGALPARQVAGCSTWVTSRLTPAGTAPGPLPHPVVLVEVGADDARPVDVLAYQLAIACERAGAPAAVEVVVAGAERPEYQQAALRAARPVHGDGAVRPTEAVGPEPVEVRSGDQRPGAVGPPAPEPAVAQPSWPPTGSMVLPPAPEPTPAETTIPGPAAVVQPEQEQPETAQPERDLREPALPEPALPEPVLPEVAEPAPARRPFAPLRGLSGPDDRRPTRAVTPLPRPAAAPSPVPLGRRASRPLAPVGDDGTAAPVRALPTPPPGTGTPALASLGDPLNVPVEPEPPRETTIDEHDPLGLGRLPVAVEEPDLEPTTAAADTWLADWISGDWAMSRSALDPASEHTEFDQAGSDEAASDRPAFDQPAFDPPAPDRREPDRLTSGSRPYGSLTSVEVPFASDGPAFPRPAASEENAEPPFAEPSPVERATDPTPPPERRTRPRVEIDRVDPPPPRPARRRPPPAPPARAGVPPETQLEQTGFILRPESVARLSDADRELLARLQSDLGESPRPKVVRRAGIAGDRDGESAATNGRGQRPASPPDMAG